jgi:FkbM family methyltransferase
MPGSGLVYRARYLESLTLANELFARPSYQRALAGPPIRTFADIGSNVGYFGCLLAHTQGTKQIAGVMIDANAEMIEESSWHCRENGLADIHPVYGVVGFPEGQKSATFHLNPANISSSTKTFFPDRPLKGKERTVEVGCLSIEAVWKERMADARCDLLKVDIEGGEGDFLRNCGVFLARVDRVLLEWHKWHCSFEEIRGLLEQGGLSQIEVLEEGPNAGILLASR